MFRSRINRYNVAIIKLMIFIAILYGSTMSAKAEPLRIVALGDSLTAGYGLEAGHTYPARLQKALENMGLDVVIDNAGVSGDTAQGGLARIDWSVPDGTRAVLLGLGANDMLRGLPPPATRQTLTALIEKLRHRNIAVMLLGMRAAPNMGDEYRKAFDSIYPELAAQYKLPLYPFFLEGVAGHPSLNQHDGLHPTAEGVEVIVNRLTPEVAKFIKGL